VHPFPNYYNPAPAGSETTYNVAGQRVDAGDQPGSGVYLTRSGTGDVTRTIRLGGRNLRVASPSSPIGASGGFDEFSTGRFTGGAAEGETPNDQAIAGVPLGAFGKNGDGALPSWLPIALLALAAVFVLKRK